MDRSIAPPVAACVVVVAALAAAPLAVEAPAARAPAPGDATAAVAAGPPSPTDNTTARLAIPPHRIERTEFETVTLGMGSTLGAGVADVRSRHEQLTIRAEFGAADTLQDKRSVIDRTLIRLETRSRELQARERAAIRNYSDGTISGAELVRRLASIDAEARRIQSTVELLDALRKQAKAPWLYGRITNVRVRVETLQGPVRRRAARALAGEASTTRIYVEVANRSLVLSTLVDGRYVREATDWWNRQAQAESALRFEDVDARGEELYPWAFSESSATSIEAPAPDTYRVTVFHPQGQLLAYLDARSADVFREVQTLSIAAMPTVSTLTYSGEGLRVTLRRTYAGGPVRILVEEAATDASVNAAVTVDGRALGRTGIDGTVMTIEPRPPYRLNVANGGASLNVTVRSPPDAGPSEG